MPAVHEPTHSINAYIGISADMQIAPAMGLERSIGKAERDSGRQPKQ